MSDETANRSAGAPDGRRSPPSGGKLGSPLQTQAAFLKNRDWLAVGSINRGACERGRAQHGVNSETGAACASEWERLRFQTLTLGETLDQLRAFQCQAPFLFFNGNTFAAIGRGLAPALFSDSHSTRKRELSAAVGHSIAGALDRESMAGRVDDPCASADFKPGDEVKTPRGSMSGKIIRRLKDGRVAWRADSARGADCVARKLDSPKEKAKMKSS
jgi:hypothetical protein